MQTKRLHPKFYYISKIDERDYSKIVWDRKQKLDLFETLSCEGCAEDSALRAIETSRATYYRLKARYKKNGLSGLENKSRMSHNVRHFLLSLVLRIKCVKPPINFVFGARRKLLLSLRENLI